MDKKKEELKKCYENACNNYLHQLLTNWGLYEDNEGSLETLGWWVADEIGGVYCIEDDTFINMDDIRYCVDNNVSRDTYEEYVEYDLKCSEYGFNTINLASFVCGAPRIPQEAFDRLSQCKQTLYDEIEKVKSEQANI